MKNISLLLASCLLALSGMAQAGGLDNEVVPMAYMSLPLGGQQAESSQLQYGFGMAVAKHDMETGWNFMQNGSPRPLDFAFTGKEFTSIKINGVDTLERTLVHHADGTTTTIMGMSKDVVVPVLIFGGAAVAVALADEDDDEEEPE